MATAEDRAHAERLLYEHRRRLRALELRKVRQGDNADASLDTQIDDERRDVHILEALLEPSPSDDVSDAVRRNTEGDFDFTMLFLQGVKQNERITKIEGDLATVAQQASSEQLWRLDVKAEVEDLKQEKEVRKANDRKAEHGRRRNLWLLVLNMALLFAMLGFMVWITAQIGAR